MNVCAVAVCDEPVKGRGWCKAHYQRWLDKGDPGTTPIRKKQPGSLCSVEGCTSPHYARFYCLPHYRRWLAGNPTGGNEFVVRPVGREDLGYFTQHKRIAAARGPAAQFACIECGGQARHWAYQHDDPDELIDETGLPYSDDMDCYAPMCVVCHRRFDRLHGQAQAS